MAGIRSARIVSTLVLSLGLAWLTGCAAMGGGGSSGSSSSGVSVTPAAANVRAGDTQQFSAKLSTMDRTVTWAVNGTAGGNATIGRISTTGVYTAPAALPTPDSVSIQLPPRPTLALRQEQHYAGESGADRDRSFPHRGPGR